MILTNLLTNMVVTSLTGMLSTNCSNQPAFREYMFNRMFQEASNVATAWKLDIGNPVKTNAVTQFVTRATVEGPNGTLTFKDRYLFSWGAGEFVIFEDKAYSEQLALTDDVDRNDAIYETWMRAKDSLTMARAQVIAESAMASLGIPMRSKKFRKPEFTKQMTYTWKDGKTYPLPLYRFRWDCDELGCNYEVQVSGITSNVLYCYFNNTGTSIHPTNSLHPADYFKMLQLPPNPIFVTPIWHQPGKPPTYDFYTNFLK